MYFVKHLPTGRQSEWKTIPEAIAWVLGREISRWGDGPAGFPLSIATVRQIQTGLEESNELFLSWAEDAQLRVHAGPNPLYRVWQSPPPEYDEIGNQAFWLLSPNETSAIELLAEGTLRSLLPGFRNAVPGKSVYLEIIPLFSSPSNNAPARILRYNSAAPGNDDAPREGETPDSWIIETQLQYKGKTGWRLAAVWYQTEKNLPYPAPSATKH